MTTKGERARRLPQVTVRNLQRKIRLNLRALQRFATTALAGVVALDRRPARSTDDAGEIFVLLISDERMARLHQRFLHQAGPTDVITFQHGEIFVSVPTARRQARQFGTSLLREIQLYIVHGLLHLHGFDDHTAAERSRMRAAEAAVLRRSAGLK